jgi:uncharacterized protein (DUF2249 family)/quercetin dioxygenase-like cupin family protein
MQHQRGDVPGPMREAGNRPESSEGNLDTHTDAQPIFLERQVRFDQRHPAAVQLETALPGQVLLIGMRAGQHLREHRVATPITIHVLRGEGTLTAEDASYPARAGMLLPLAANVAHGATAETDLVLLVTRAAVAEAEIIEPDAAQDADATEPVALDVRDLAPRDRHTRIFATFDGLRPGGALRLVNDHDPKPLKYQFAAEHAGEATWEPEQEGPEVWVVRIGKVAAGA